MRPPDAPASWTRTADEIERSAWARILVIGAADRGKSSYCSFLACRLAAAGHPVALVDADVGQKDLGPPTTITLGYWRQPDRTPERVEASYFVGSTSPVGHMLPMVVGTRRLVDEASAPFVLINTTGLVGGVGRVLKEQKIAAIEPDAIVALAIGDELAPLLRSQRHRRILSIEPSTRAVAKTPEDRRRLREASFGRYFQKAATLELPLDRLAVQGSLFLNGEALDDPRYVYAEKTPEGLTAVVRPGTAPPSDPVRLLPEGFERDLLCGLADEKGKGLGLAILRHLDFPRRSVSLVTPVSPERIGILELGSLYVGRDGIERGPAPRL